MWLAFWWRDVHGRTSNGELFHITEKLRTTPFSSVTPSIRYQPGTVLGGMMFTRDSTVAHPGAMLADMGGKMTSGCEPSIATSECEKM